LLPAKATKNNLLHFDVKYEEGKMVSLFLDAQNPEYKNNLDAVKFWQRLWPYLEKYQVQSPPFLC
jgi:hypothetical protein